ncbi:unnamed protein product [Mytilus edulis]|uniref:Uncharacterized protein n=1 Tax=Mytilus edulis TaxID=6550 RepID=A0A8S3SRR2_MYTED|nr:unnamed protein product [Mytilus edulis]
MPTKFKLKTEFKVPYCYWRIASMFITNENRMLLCCSGNKSKALLEWSETGDHIQDCKLAAPVWGIAMIPGRNEAVVTLPDINSVQFVNIARMVPGKSMKVPDECHGVTVMKDMIVWGGLRKVYFVNMTGILMKTFNIGSEYLLSLETNKMGMIYCCEAGYDTLHCIDTNGTVIFSYSSPEFEVPVDMALDCKQNLYVTTLGTNKLNRLSKDRKIIDIILNKEDGLDEPYGIAFNKNYTKLYISNGRLNKDKQVLIYDCA